MYSPPRVMWTFLDGNLTITGEFQEEQKVKNQMTEIAFCKCFY